MRKIICIDAGHGGKDSGALGPNGLRECDVALSVAMLLGAALLTEFDVVFTRQKDEFIPLGARATRANDAQADAFVSVHCNSAASRAAEGFEVFTTPGLTVADALATDVFLSWADEFPLAAKRMDISDGDPDKEASFSVLRNTRMRAILFELDFISTPRIELMLQDPKWQARAARALANGIRKHFDVATQPASQPLPLPADPKVALRQKLAELYNLVERL